MSTPLDLASRPSSRPATLTEEVGLAALLELCAADEPAQPVRRSFRATGVQLRSWVHDSSRRAAGWGALTPSIARHGNRPLLSGAEPQ